MTPPNDCGAIGELLPEFLAGRVSEADDQRIREHLAECADCRNRANAVSLLQQTPVPAPDPERWQGFVDGVVTATEGKRRPAGLRFGWALVAVMAAAAVLIFSWIRVARMDLSKSVAIEALAREVAELPPAEAGAWTVGLSSTGFMSPGFDTADLSEQELEELLTEVGRS